MDDRGEPEKELREVRKRKSPNDFSLGLHLNVARVERFADFKS